MSGDVEAQVPCPGGCGRVIEFEAWICQECYEGLMGMESAWVPATKEDHDDKTD